MPLTETIIQESVKRYRRELDRYSKLATYVAARCQSEIVKDNAIRANVTWRVKAPDKLDGKLRRLQLVPAETATLDSVDAVFGRIGDLAGVRISTYQERDRDKVVEHVKRLFRGPNGGTVEVDRKDTKEKFYRATHCQVMLAAEQLEPPNDNLEDISCEVQVCSLLAHVWNEVEHDLGYKPTTGSLSVRERDSLDLLGHLTVSGDTAIKQLFDATDERLAQTKSQFHDVFDFVARLRKRFPASTEFGQNAGQLFDELVALGLNTPDSIESTFLIANFEERGRSLVDEYTKYVEDCGDAITELDAASSDPFLMLVLEKRADTIYERHPTGRGQGRPPRIVSVAKRFLEMQAEKT